MMSLWNRPCSPLLVNGSLFAPRLRRNLLSWMLLPAVSGEEGSSNRSWTFECSTRMFSPTPRYPYPPCTSGTRQKKRRRYEARVRDVGHASFVPIVFSVAGGCGKAATVLMKRIGSMLCQKRNESFSVVMASMRCCISFALLRSAVESLRGHRAVRQKSPPEPSAELAVVECQLAL